jgi:methanogenic corrinoid protein MtbC1
VRVATYDGIGSALQRWVGVEVFMTGQDVDALEDALLDLDQVAALRILEEAGGGKLSTQTLEYVVVPALQRIGEAWERGDAALSQLYMSGRLCERLIGSLDVVPVSFRPDQPCIAIGVLDDSHILGKKIVLQMLRSAGYQVRDLGARLSIDDLVDAVRLHDVEVLVVSVLMLRSALKVSALRERLARHGPAPTLVVGGAPFRFDPALAGEVGADYAGNNASDILPIMAQIERARR